MAQTVTDVHTISSSHTAPLSLSLSLCQRLNHRSLFLAHASIHSPPKVRWMGLQKLSGYNPHVKPFEAPRSVAIACFYIAVFLFFEMAWDYCSEMLAPAFGMWCVNVLVRCVYVCVCVYVHSMCVCMYICVCMYVCVVCLCVCVCV